MSAKRKRAKEQMANSPDKSAEDQARDSAAERPEEGASPEEAAPSRDAEGALSDAERIAQLEQEVASLKDQLLRALAEGENQRRRGQREREEALRYASAPLARDLLTVADNLTRALESVREEATEDDEALQTLLEGVRLTERELQAAFERHHIVRLEPLGERLNPHHHEAMYEVPDADAPAGTIVQVMQPGYLLHDRLLRPARVGVAKGAPGASGPDGEAGEAAAPKPNGGSDPSHSPVDTDD